MICAICSSVPAAEVVCCPFVGDLFCKKHLDSFAAAIFPGPPSLRCPFCKGSHDSNGFVRVSAAEDVIVAIAEEISEVARLRRELDALKKSYGRKKKEDEERLKRITEEIDSMRCDT